MEGNKGIIQSGGNITANTVGVGDNVNIQTGDQNLANRSNDMNELSGLLESLINKIKSPDLALKDKEDIVSSLETVRGELKKEKPNKITVMSIGKSILENLKNVLELAPVVTTIWDKIHILF